MSFINNIKLILILIYYFVDKSWKLISFKIIDSIQWKWKFSCEKRIRTLVDHAFWNLAKKSMEIETFFPLFQREWTYWTKLKKILTPKWQEYILIIITTWIQFSRNFVIVMAKIKIINVWKFSTESGAYNKLKMHSFLNIQLLIYLFNIM